MCMQKLNIYVIICVCILYMSMFPNANAKVTLMGYVNKNAKMIIIWVKYDQIKYLSCMVYLWNDDEVNTIHPDMIRPYGKIITCDGHQRCLSTNIGHHEKTTGIYAKTRIHSFTAELNFEDFSWELKLMSSRRSWFLENWYGNWFHLNSRRSWLLCGIAFILFQGGTDFWGALFGIEFLIVSEELILGELFGEWVLINFKAELNFEDFLWEIEI